MSIVLPACAKINLTLEVLGRRPDGYHEIVSVIQTVDLCDTITVAIAPSLFLEAPDVGCAPADNLVMRAARLLKDATGCIDGALIRLEKQIPSAAGLGGGSSDAASTLVALNRLWHLRMNRDELALLAARLGSDVPFFFFGPTALARGRGDLLEALPPLDGHWAVLVTPQAHLSNKTRTLYDALLPADLTDGGAGLRIAADLRAGHPFDPEGLVNAFERAAYALFPQVAGCRAALEAAGAPFVRLSGSGPTLFTIVPDRPQAQAIVSRLAAHGIAGRAARLLGDDYALRAEIRQNSD